MVVHGSVEILTVGGVASLVVFRNFDVKVRNPAKLSIDISFSGDFGPIGESCSLQFVIFIWIRLATRGVSNDFLVSEGLVEQLLVVLVIFVIKS